MKLKGWKEIPFGGMILEAGNAVEYRTGDWRAFRPVRGKAECTHCFQCWLYCPDSSILVDAETEEMVGFDLEHCKGCGICAAVCPVNAKVKRKAGQDLARDDARLCILMVEEGSLSKEPEDAECAGGKTARTLSNPPSLKRSEEGSCDE